MNNYLEFTRFDEDGVAMDIFNGMSNERLKDILDSYFNELEDNLNFFASSFKSMLNEKDYNRCYYKTNELIDKNNDIKIILNILLERNNINE